MMGLLSILGGISYLIGAERWIPAVTRRVICSAPSLSLRERGSKTIALTFDDGPHPEHTAVLLSKLASHGVPATFFLIGRNLQRYPDLGRAIVQAGHEIANHTFSHRRLPFLSDADIRSEIITTDELIRDILGARPLFFRPPYGLFTQRVLDAIESLDYRCVIGNVFPLDLACPRADVIAQRVLRRAKPGSIVILHDLCWGKWQDSPLLAALDRLIPRLKERGYRFVSVGKLLRGSTANDG